MKEPLYFLDHDLLRRDILAYQLTRTREQDGKYFSLSDLADESGLSKSTFSKFYRQKVGYVIVDTLCKIAHMIGRKPTRYFTTKKPNNANSKNRTGKKKVA